MLFQIPDILLAVTAITNTGLIWFVYQRDRDKPVNKLFALFVVFITFWALIILLFRQVDSVPIALYLLKLSYIAALLLAFFFYRFSFLFPKPTPVHRLHTLITTTFVSAVSIYILFPGVLTENVVFHSWGKEVVLEPFAYWLFAASFLFFFLFGQARLLLKIPQASGVERVQLLIIASTVVVAGLFGMYYNLLLPSPFFHDFQYIWSGPVFTFAFAVVITYSIFRFRLFNPRAILAELLVYTLLLFLFIRLILTNVLSDLVINGALLITVAIVGALLIKSVTKEVEQREEIERLSEEKSEFMTFASHEIRNPITAMRGYASLIVDGTTGEAGAQTKDAAEKILVNGDTVLSLISQFLNKSKLELGQIAYAIADVDVGKTIRSIAEGFRAHAEQKGLSLDVKVDFPNLLARADESKLREVVGNIVDNSLKYTKTGDITVEIEKRNGMARITIADTGVGIPPETLPHLFQKFSRADAQKMNLLGTGLGLYLAKTFIEGMGGKIWAESDGKDKGSRFIIELHAV
ncbi:MAG TPA: ATP-binding protein [Candidatus Paceibacterota bacterium]|nr:ATP-binding protein [Candidatus Paceibacterota bacterium]